MKFTMTHVFDVERATMEKHLNDPELLEMAREIPNLKGRELVEYREEAKLRIWKFRNAALGEIPANARLYVKPEMLAWTEESTWDPDTHAFTWRTVPSHFSEILSAEGTWRLEEAGAKTRRVIDGELRVKLPVVGRVVEQFIIELVKANFTAEAEVQRRFYAKIKGRTG